MGSSPQLFVGTSGYSYKEWKGSFYPKDLPAKSFLKYYGERFNTCEINGTFYRMPTADQLKAWLPDVPSNFKFTLKSPQIITHFKRLKDAKAPLTDLLNAAKALKNQLGPILFGLPPNMKKDAARLSDFLELLPEHPFAFEFRNATWFDDEIFDLLRKHQVALCLAESDDGVEVPFVSTADWGYVRLRCADYGDKELKDWAKRIKGAAWSDTFIFFKHEDEGKGPKMAQRFLELVRA